ATPPWTASPSPPGGERLPRTPPGNDSSVPPSEAPHTRVSEAPSPDTPAALARHGPRVGDYDLPCELGRGGTGGGYTAVHRTLKRVVALKLILAGSHAGPDQWAPV